MKYDALLEEDYKNTKIQYGIKYGNDNNKVLLIKTGQNGTIYGSNDKYLVMSSRVSYDYGINVVVSSNQYDGTDSLGQAIEVINRLIPNVSEIYYFGNSNGASLGARYGYVYPQITRMLLVNAPIMINWPQTKSGLNQFMGEYAKLIYGEYDPSFKYCEMINLAQNEDRIQLIKYEGADHQFIGKEEEFLNLPMKYLLEDK